MRLGALFILLLASACATPQLGGSLSGSSWQLVRFQDGDGKVIVPTEPARYTVAFGDDGVVNVRFDCNRGRGSWKSPGKNRLEFGPMALTRAACPPGSLHDQLVKHWPFIRSYTLRDGRLYLALMADGGTYELRASPSP